MGPLDSDVWEAAHIGISIENAGGRHVLVHGKDTWCYDSKEPSENLAMPSAGR